MYYELAYLLDPPLAEKDQPAALTAVKALIADAGGNLINELPPESRVLGYPIRKSRRALMAVQVFSLPSPKEIAALKAKMALLPQIRRVMITRHKTAPDYLALKTALAAATFAGRRPKTAPAALPIDVPVPAPKAVSHRKPVKSRAAAPSPKKKKAAKDIDESIKEIIGDKIKV